MSSGRSATQAEREFFVSLDSVRKSGRVLYAFATFYLPIYDRDIRFLFERYDFFGTVSAAIYDIDELIEAGAPVQDALTKLQRLTRFVQDRAVLDSYVLQTFEDARRYYDFEHRLLQEPTCHLGDLRAITEIRSFDFRLMHRLLVQAIGGTYCEPVFSWFCLFEQLMEVEDDLSSYDEDLTRGTFNIWALAERAAPGGGATFVRTYRGDLEKGLHERLRALSPLQSVLCERSFGRYREIVPPPSLADSFGASGAP